METKTLVTTSIPYVNSSPHIGFTLELVQADTLARYYRILKHDTYFLTGSDENAIKNVEAAEKQGVSTQELVDKNAARFMELKDALNVTFDQFIRTTAPKHKTGSQRFWELCKKDIYKKTYQGLYCTGCETFYKDGEFPDNICPNHNRKLEVVSEENYFFALSKYQDQVKKILIENKVQIYPEYRKQEVLNFIDKGLEDFSISRPVERSKGWGIPVPNDESQNMYVWFDALTNYITALDFDTQGELFKTFWSPGTNIFQIVGKDIIKFHGIYWIAMLLSAGLRLPNKLYVHGFINVDGKKMSKSLGNVIDPFELVKQYGADSVRYYLLREIPSLDDGDFSHSRMHELYTTDLANELGNLVVRVTTLGEKDALVMEHPHKPFISDYHEHFSNYQFNGILESIWELIKGINKEINDFEPWKKVASERKSFLEKTLVNIYAIGCLLEPFIPQTAQTIQQATSGTIKKVPPLFPRLEK